MKRFMREMFPMTPAFEKPRLSIRDVARRANCAVGSASRVLNGNAEVSPAIKKRVLQAMEDMNYVPNRHARNLKSGRTYRLGLLMPFASDLYYATLLDAFNETVMETDYRLDVQFHRWMEKEEDKAIRHFVEAGMEGIIMAPSRSFYENVPSLRLIAQHKINCVMVGTPHSNEGQFPFFTVGQDSGMGMELLADHLASLGHCKIALLLPAANNSYPGMGERIAGVEKALTRHPGVCFEPIFLQENEGVPSEQDFRMHGTSMALFRDYMGKLVEKFLSHKQEITAVITANQMTAGLLIDALKERGIRVPEDVSVTALGLSNTGHFGGLSLTMAEYSPMEIAAKAIGILQKKATQNIAIQPTLACRWSSGPQKPGAFFPASSNTNPQN